MTVDCPVCLIDHDDEIHAATVRAHQYLKRTIDAYLNPAAQPEPEHRTWQQTAKREKYRPIDGEYC